MARNSTSSSFPLLDPGERTRNVTLPLKVVNLNSSVDFRYEMSDIVEKAALRKSETHQSAKIIDKRAPFRLLVREPRHIAMSRSASRENYQSPALVSRSAVSSSEARAGSRRVCTDPERKNPTSGTMSTQSALSSFSSYRCISAST